MSPKCPPKRREENIREENIKENKTKEKRAKGCTPIFIFENFSIALASLFLLVLQCKITDSLPKRISLK
jgi:hypothetical protein